ncbi:MAG: hypothetical protein JXA79_01345 [Deltaproteobacteria bacterium]|nr:hypothetical protein [Deltaproteobacteria bacterium]
MASTGDINIVLGQGSAIKEVHNVRKQSLELNQQFVAQRTEDKKKEEKKKVQEFDTDNKIKISNDEEKKGTEDKDKRNREKDSGKKQLEDELKTSDYSFIDIKV